MNYAEMKRLKKEAAALMGQIRAREKQVNREDRTTDPDLISMRRQMAKLTKQASEVWKSSTPGFDGKTYSKAEDHERLTTQLGAIRKTLQSAHPAWKTLRELEDLTGYPQASISARIRDLRKEKFGGWEVGARRRAVLGGGTWEYRVEPSPAIEEGEL